MLESIDALRDDVAAGLSYRTYMREMNAVRHVYFRLPLSEMEIDCLKNVAAPIESGFNEYVYAADAWTECIEDLYCDQRAFMPVIENKWQVSRAFLAEAHAALAGRG